MSRVKVKDILQHATEHHYRVAAVNTINVETARYIIQAAEREQVPVIVQFFPGFHKYMSLKHLAFAACDMADRASVPVGVHLDHSAGYEIAVGGIRDGFPSIMVDGSSLPFEENVALTKKVVDYAHTLGITVEGELGKLVGEEGDLIVKGPEAAQTDPAEAKEFVERTGVDCLAVSIGTQHGHYVAAPHLNIERLKAIKEVVDVPLVLHGGSGTPIDQVQEAIRNGIRKINVATDVLTAVADSFEELKKQPEFKYNTAMFIHSKNSAKEFIKGKMKDFRFES